MFKKNGASAQAVPIAAHIKINNPIIIPSIILLLLMLNDALLHHHSLMAPQMHFRAYLITILFDILVGQLQFDNGCDYRSPRTVVYMISY